MWITLLCECRMCTVLIYLGFRRLVTPHEDTPSSGQQRVGSDRHSSISIVIYCIMSLSLSVFSLSNFLHAGSPLQQDSQDEGLCYYGESDSEHPSSALASLCLSFLLFTSSSLCPACLIPLFLSFCLSFLQCCCPKVLQQITHIIYKSGVWKMFVQQTWRV